MVHRISDLLGTQSSREKLDKQTNKLTDRHRGRPPDLALIQDSNIADSGVNIADVDINSTSTPLSTVSFTYESCDSPYSYGTYSYNSTLFSTDSLVNVKQ